MPKKIRELKSLLRKAGFELESGRGSHTNWFHPRFPGRITLSGNDGRDARRYQEDEVRKAIRIVQERL
jgi:predicted RNA binding protein YcfA (HicA-like mRNA interferase family)